MELLTTDEIDSIRDACGIASDQLAVAAQTVNRPALAAAIKLSLPHAFRERLKTLERGVRARARQRRIKGA